MMCGEGFSRRIRRHTNRGKGEGRNLEELSSLARPGLAEQDSVSPGRTLRRP